MNIKNCVFKICGVGIFKIPKILNFYRNMRNSKFNIPQKSKFCWNISEFWNTSKALNKFNKEIYKKLYKKFK